MRRLIRVIRAQEGEGVVVTDRVQNQDWSDLVQADIDCIGLQVFDASQNANDDPVFVSELINVSDTVFDTLQLDGYWTRDTEGYNFRHTLDVYDLDEFAKGGTTFLMEYKFDLSDGSFRLFPVRLQVEARRTVTDALL